MGNELSHYCEVYTPDSATWQQYGVQCLLCGWEADGFDDWDAADFAGDQHLADSRGGS